MQNVNNDGMNRNTKAAERAKEEAAQNDKLKNDLQATIQQGKGQVNAVAGAMQTTGSLLSAAGSVFSGVPVLGAGLAIAGLVTTGLGAATQATGSAAYGDTAQAIDAAGKGTAGGLERGKGIYDKWDEYGTSGEATAEAAGTAPAVPSAPNSAANAPAAATAAS